MLDKLSIDTQVRIAVATRILAAIIMALAGLALADVAGRSHDANLVQHFDAVTWLVCGNAWIAIGMFVIMTPESRAKMRWLRKATVATLIALAVIDGIALGMTFEADTARGQAAILAMVVAGTAHLVLTELMIQDAYPGGRSLCRPLR